MFTRLLATLARALSNAGIPYMVIGGQAVLLYGEPRLTKDIDLTLGVGIEAYETVLALVRDVGLRPLVDTKAFTEQTMVLPCQDPESGIRVDFIFSNSAYEQEALGRTRTVVLEGVPVSFASAEDVVIHKVIAGRPRDLDDVRAILAKNPQIDQQYIEEWLARFSEALTEPFLERFDRLRKGDNPPT